jgi:hypothetical protein
VEFAVVRAVVGAGVAGAVVVGAAGVVDGVDGAVGVAPDVPTGCDTGRTGAAVGVCAIAGTVLSRNSKPQKIDVFIANILY